jgi:hypothetical protein
VAAEIHPTENRGFRELNAISREIVTYWSQLARRLEKADPDAAAALEKGAETARELIAELRPLTAARGVHGGARAQGAGQMLAVGRSSLRDPFLERNQALRLALGDIEHLATLLAYLAARAADRSDQELEDFFSRWERKVRRLASPVRKAAIAQAADPDGAIEPVVDGPVGHLAHGVTYLAGTLGEWSDRHSADE